MQKILVEACLLTEKPKPEVMFLLGAFDKCPSVWFEVGVLDIGVCAEVTTSSKVGKEVAAELDVGEQLLTDADICGLVVLSTSDP